MLEPFVLLAVVGVVGLVVWLEKNNKTNDKSPRGPSR